MRLWIAPALLLLTAACGTGPASPPLPGSLNATAPNRFQVRVTTTQGDFVIDVEREWAPHGADRFFNLVSAGFYQQNRFFRVVPKYIQWGIPADPTVAEAWREATISDEPVRQSNLQGYVSFAAAGPNSRTTQVFINRIDNPNLDAMGFAPFGHVSSGFEVLNKLHAGYGEGAPRGAGPDQRRIRQEGEAYLAREFPLLDRIVTARLVR